MSDLNNIYGYIGNMKAIYDCEIKIPLNKPDGCNIVGYQVDDFNRVIFYKEESGTLSHYLSDRTGWEETGNTCLVDEVLDDIDNGYEYVYLRLNEEKDKFTPDCLLGVETTKGYIVDVFGGDWTNPLTCFSFKTTDGTCYSNYSNFVKYYISDENDETVSFNEYVDLFYER